VRCARTARRDDNGREPSRSSTTHFCEMTLSVIVPAYHAADTLRSQLPAFVSWLKGKNITHELIVVDDGSGDERATEEVAYENGCVFIRLERNLGKGAAVRAGMLAAKGDFRIFTDADIPFEFDAVERFLDSLKDRRCDIAIGDRRLPESSYFSKITGTRKLGSLIFMFVVGRFVTTGLFDTQCGMKGFSSRAANDLFSVAQIDGFAFDVELLYIALKRRYDIKRLPVVFRSNHEESSASLIRHAPGMLMDLVKIKWNDLRGEYAAVKSEQ
jgi:dolichyl-phosphate beta-glucosyltransferase